RRFNAAPGNGSRDLAPRVDRQGRSRAPRGPLLHLDDGGEGDGFTLGEPAFHITQNVSHRPALPLPFPHASPWGPACRGGPHGTAAGSPAGPLRWWLSSRARP